MPITRTVRCAADRLGAQLLTEQLTTAPDRNAVICAPGVQLLLAVAFAGMGPIPTLDTLLGTCETERCEAYRDVVEALGRLEPAEAALRALDHIVPGLAGNRASGVPC